MLTTIQSWLGRSNTPGTRQKSRLNLESLDDRTLLSVALSGGTLTVTGTVNHDTAVVSPQEFSGVSWLLVNERTTGGTADGVPRASWFRAADVSRIVFHGSNGNDVFTNDTALPSEAHGGDGRDTLTGGGGIDALYGDAGHDKLFGNGGGDALYGYAGDDVLQGGAGNDWLYGGNDNDKLFGGTSYDFVYGEGGDDFLDDGGGWNALDGGPGEDFNARVLAYGGATKEDVDQVGSPTCGCLAAIASVAHTGQDLLTRITYLDVGDSRTNPVYRVTLFRDGAWRNFDIPFNGDQIFRGDGVLMDAWPKVVPDGSQGCERESWVTILQRAYLQAKGVDWRDPADIEARGTCDPGHVMKALTGRDSDEYRIGWANDNDKDRIINALRNNKPVVACTVDQNWRLSTETLVKWHCYSVIDWDTRDGTTYFKVRNPWAEDGGTELNGIEGFQGADLNPNDGEIELTWHDFKRSMQHYWING